MTTPHRTPRHAATDDPPRWWPPMLAAGLLGTLALVALLAAGGLYVADVVLSWLAAR